MNPVHVAVDAHNLARDDRGIGRYARAVLARAIRDERFRWTFVVRDLLPRRAPIAAALDAGADAEIRVARRVPASAGVVWFPWNGTFLRANAPSVATVHDAAPFAFPAPDPRLRAREQEPFLLTARTARRILVQSEFTAGEVERRLDVERARIVVTPLAVDAAFSPGPAGRHCAALGGRPYVLHVGAHDERKNSATLIEAFEAAFPRGEIVLVFTRRPPVLPAHALVVEAKDDAALIALYHGATLVAVPSLYEGFGLPLLEAMACGAPVLAARAGALPEVGGDACAWVDDVLEPEAWMSALRTLAQDGEERARLRAVGPQQAARFSWERCTAQTLAVLRDVAGAA